MLRFYNTSNSPSIISLLPVMLCSLLSSKSGQFYPTQFPVFKVACVLYSEVPVSLCLRLYSEVHRFPCLFLLYSSILHKVCPLVGGSTWCVSFIQRFSSLYSEVHRYTQSVSFIQRFHSPCLRIPPSSLHSSVYRFMQKCVSFIQRFHHSPAAKSTLYPIVYAISYSCATYAMV